MAGRDGDRGHRAAVVAADRRAAGAQLDHGVAGRWLAQADGVHQVGRTVFVHTRRIDRNADRRFVLRIVDRDFSWVGNQTRAVFNGVVDRRWIAFEVRFWREGDRTRGRIDRPSAFARHHQGFTTVGAAHNLYRARIEVAVGIAVVFNHVHHHWVAQSAAGGVIGRHR